MLHDGKFYIKLGLPSGNAFPTAPAPTEGDVFYREDEDKVYSYDGADWNHIGKGVPAADVINVPAGGIAATDVQAAIDELDTEKAAVAQQAWQAPVFENAWVNFGAPYATAAYMKDNFGFVHLRGMVKDGTIGLTIFTLPAGYRPSAREIFSVVTGLSASSALHILADGRVWAAVGSNEYITLSGITFRAA